MIELDAELEKQSYAKTQKLLKSLLVNFKDLRPIFEEFATYYRGFQVIVFETKGKAAGRRWKAVNKRYKKEKRKEGFGNKTLIRTKKMMEAAQNFKVKLTNDQLTMEMEREEYFYIRQADRPYFYTKKKKLPKRAMVELIKMAHKRLLDGRKA